MQKQTIENFMKSVNKQEDGCWVWMGLSTPNGYGWASLGGRTQAAHRVAWKLIRGEIPAETLDHLCRVRLCVNPDHMEPVSRAINGRRAQEYRWAGEIYENFHVEGKRKYNVPRWLEEYVLNY